MSEWKEIQLRNVSSDISYGYTASAESKNTGTKFLRITDITSGRINWETVPFCKISDKDFQKYKLQSGDIVIARTGATTGYNAIMKNDVNAVYASYLIRFQIDKTKANPFFVGHILQSSNFQDYVDAIAGGSAQPGANAQQLADFEFLLPPLPTQTAIAEVLSSLDDKIDLLHQNNKTLEAMAEAIFRKMMSEPGFMRLNDYPDEKKSRQSLNQKNQSSDNEEEKWKTKSEKLGDVIKTTSGGTPSRSKMEYYENGIVRWIKSKELSGDFIFETEEMITEDAIKNSSAKLLPANSILIAMYGATVGEYAILANEATCNQAICALIPNENYPYTYLFLLTKTNKENLLNLAVGSAQQNISQLLIKEIEVSSDIKGIKQFHETVSPLFEKIKSNSQQIRTLTQLRDTLLPKLMSGEIKVSEL